jgi:serine/threonine protein kinase
MTLTQGTRLGPYEIVAPLGAGGMGEVYKARDTRLDRTVAIKILPAALAGDPRFRERFDREARAISSLDHPHICALYDVGDEQGVSFLVMQFLEGETLAARIARGPMTLDEALPLAMQIADALDRAHRAGIVHRDLKPGNVFLVRSVGASARPSAKLLDFGLARTVAGGAGQAGRDVRGVRLEADLTAPQTMAAPLTQEGTILGTIQYMAPEQLEGADADERADIWAFGAVLYEMVTGRKAFEGPSQASVIGAIMTQEPAPISALQPVAPRALDALIAGCLTKAREERWQSIRDVKRQLTGVAAEEAPSVSRAASRSWARVALASAAAFVLGIAALTGFGWLIRRDAPASVVRFDVTPLSGGTIERRADTHTYLAASPDGTRIAFVASVDGQRAIWIKAQWHARLRGRSPGSTASACARRERRR